MCYCKNSHVVDNIYWPQQGHVVIICSTLIAVVISVSDSSQAHLKETQGTWDADAFEEFKEANPLALPFSHAKLDTWPEGARRVLLKLLGGRESLDAKEILKDAWFWDIQEPEEEKVRARFAGKS
jgi:hypothetical protein